MFSDRDRIVVQINYNKISTKPKIFGNSIILNKRRSKESQRNLKIV